MKRETFSELLGEINESYVKEAEEVNKSSKSHWYKWGTLVACLALVLVIGGVTLLHPMGGPKQDDFLPPIHLLVYQGAYYEAVDMSDTALLARFNLPNNITEDMIGNSMGKVLDAGGEDTQGEFYHYVPYAHISATPASDTLNQKRPQSAVYILKESEAYTFALFCNFIPFDTNTHTEAEEMFVVYGVDEAADIVSITANGEKYTDFETIESFFRSLNESNSLGNDDFQKMYFGDKSEEEQQEISTALADSVILIEAQTNGGIKIPNIHYYPTIGVVSWALNYYQL